MIKSGYTKDQSDVEQALVEAHSLLEEISNCYRLIAYCVYLDDDRSQAMELERRIAAFIAKPLYDSETTS
jgi:L-asparaginase II